ncbi:hypothetical protein [Novosphingobium sp.]|uniref:hypothetical protein n=1 Tax=Novosphingobium sp. TaxID=1874826 RepID=UPI0025FF6116|nr:hypothetical protein [Novosphingobium sp.]
MAKQQRKAPISKPITANPLFPAVAALWFGALFGLSSIALRVSVIESLVRMTMIDLVVPAAAPPLGLTARILIALLMAAIGALVGASIAKRIARPKSEKRERSRNARSVETDAPQAAGRDNHTDAPARRPIFAHEELGDEAGSLAAPSPPIQPGRRRALTLEDQYEKFVPADLAPLPGGLPQVLDLAGTELDKPPVPATVLPDLQPTVAAETDLNAYCDVDAEVEGQPENADAGVEAASEILAQPACAQHAVFGIEHFASGGDLTDLAPDDGPDEDNFAGRQVFGMGPVEPQQTEERQVFQTVEVARDQIDAVFAADTLKASVFDPLNADPLFGTPGEAPAVAAAFDAETCAVDQSADHAKDETDAIAPADRADPAPQPRLVAPPSADTAQPFPPIEDLDMVALALRLQQSMERRRAARASVLLDAKVAQDAESAGLPAAGAPLLVAGQEPDSAEPELSTMPAQLPEALRPIAFEDLADEDEDDDNDEVMASLLPPRQIFAPAQNAATVQLPVVEPRPDGGQESAAAAAGDEDDDDDGFGGESYASLLSAGVPINRSGFVRIDEPHIPDHQVEPVVIFPGQAARVALAPRSEANQPFVAPVTSPAFEDAGQFRRFDAPPSAGHGLPISASPSAPALDAEETERALRTALSNLQRISGAA